MVRVGVRIISWYNWFNFEKFINCRTQCFIKSLYKCRIVGHRDTAMFLFFVQIYSENEFTINTMNRIHMY